MNKRIYYFTFLFLLITLTGCANILNNMFNLEYVSLSEKTKKEVLELITSQMIQIPGAEYKMLKTEITQKMYSTVMGKNPSSFSLRGEDYPVISVSWYDAIYFCNKLSVITGLSPVYSVSGKTNVEEWDYTPHKGNMLAGSIEVDNSANGYRLPTKEEWRHAAKGGNTYWYSGSYNLNTVGWYQRNSSNQTHEVAKKSANDYGLYDMSGNVFEWCSSIPKGYFGDYRYICGGSYNSNPSECEIEYNSVALEYERYNHIGFRIVCNSDIDEKLIELITSQMIQIPGAEYKMLKTEITQKMYSTVMGANPSSLIGEDYPVDSVSWYDAIYFCNKLSVFTGLSPVYSVYGTTNVAEWNYTPHKGNELTGSIYVNNSANGYRLPTIEEWRYAAKGGKTYLYSGSDNINTVGWYKDNSNSQTHEVAKKSANDYGLYDMSGNVMEWCCDIYSKTYYDDYRYICGGSYNRKASVCEIKYNSYTLPYNGFNDFGLRIVCNSY